MSGRVRAWVLGLAMLALLPGLAAVVRTMPTFGATPQALGQAIARTAPQLRRLDNTVTAVNFDFRSLDTLGEEFMLLCGVTGTVLLLRGQRGEGLADAPSPQPDRPQLDRPDSSLLAARVLAPLILLYGIYITVHASVTPGGGFQGGAIAASGLVAVFAGASYRAWRDLAPSKALSALEAGGALLFAGCGLAPLAAGGAFMENLLPLGRRGDILSGGLVLLENLGVAFAVCAGFLMLFLEFLEETRAPKPQGEPGPRSKESKG